MWIVILVALEVGGFARFGGWVNWSTAESVAAPRKHERTSHGACGRFHVWSTPDRVLVQDRRGRWQQIDQIADDGSELHLVVRCEGGVVFIVVRIARDRSNDPWNTGWPRPKRWVLWSPSTQLQANVSFTHTSDQRAPSPHAIGAVLAETRRIISRVRSDEGFTERIHQIYSPR